MMGNRIVLGNHQHFTKRPSDSVLCGLTQELNIHQRCADYSRARFDVSIQAQLNASAQYAFVKMKDTIASTRNLLVMSSDDDCSGS